jgi:serine/threonine protein kinase
MEAVDRLEYKAGDWISHYRIETMLGEGTFGVVYKVYDATDGKVYALKILQLWAIPPMLRKNLVDRFEREYATGQIDSRYLVHSKDYGFHNKVPWLAMEYCPNGDLSQYTGKADTYFISKTFREILYGLRDLHHNAKVHRDLKPENVLFKADGAASLTDFGIVGDINKRLTEKRWFGNKGDSFGTYPYMPPEQFKADHGAIVLTTTDIFSFGVMLFFTITGSLPFGNLRDDDDHDALVHYINRGKTGDWDRDLLKNSDLGRQYYNVIEGCLIPDFKRRLQNTDEALALMPESHTDVASPVHYTDISPMVNGLQLRVMQGEDLGKIYRLNELIRGRARIITMGRADEETDNTIRITEEEDSCTSRKHCTLELDYQTHEWFIRDGQHDKGAPNGWRCSMNGTFVNSAQADSDGLPLSPGDVITVGDVKLRAEGY